jgi:hypothetical protein
LALYSAFALAPATAAVFFTLAQVDRGLPLDLALIAGSLKEGFRPAFLVLLPLFSLFYWLALAAGFAAGQGWPVPDVAARLGILLLGTTALYWGPISAAHPHLLPWDVLARSMRLFWRAPGPTLLTGAVCLATATLGVISIAGFFLIVPVLVALFQTQLHRSVAAKIRGT